jgi:glutathione synthase/RimK-type ligase-like ATP-grasp enzyme
MNILILTTGKGQNFGRSISHRLRRTLGSDHRVYRYRVTALNEAFQNHPEFNPSNTIIHCRAAHPTAQWMRRLIDLETAGYRVINRTASLILTSDKLLFWEMLNEVGLAAYDNDEFEVWTWPLPRRLTQQWLNDTAHQLSAGSPQGMILKPRYSQGQGTFVHHISWVNFVDLSYMQELVATMPSCPLIMQQVIDYQAIYRVVIVNGVAGTAVITYDRPTKNNWKVSVCLNRHQQHFIPSDDPNSREYQLALRLGSYAQALQRAVSGEINFIDIFETRNNELVVSEINTACNLALHSRLTGADFAEYIANYLAGEVE